MSLWILTFLVAVAHAAPPLPGSVPPAYQNPAIIPPDGKIGACSFVTGEFDYECIPLYVAYLIQLMFGLIGGFCLIQIIQGGYQVGWSGLTAENEAGKNRIKNALIGFAVSLLCFALVDMIISVVLG